MLKIIKNIILSFFIFTEILLLTNTSSFALCYSSRTSGEEIHQRSCEDTFQATGMLWVRFENGLLYSGTATLIAPDVIITAAHVLVKPNTEIKGICFQPECSPPSVTSDMFQRPKNVWFHPDYVKTRKNANHDIAVVQLARPLNHIRPAELQKTLAKNFTSAEITVVGYGLSGNNYEGGKFDDLKRRAGDITLYLDRSQKQLLYMPFTPNINKIGFIDSYRKSKYTTITESGDSGGPAFLNIDGKPSTQLLGIVRGNTLYETNGIIDSGKDIFISIPYFYSWIESKLQLCGYSGNADDNSDQSYDADDLYFDADNHEAIAWDNLIDMLSTAGARGSEIWESLYEYASKPEYKQAFEETISSMSDKALELLYEYIAIHKEMFLE